jgi:hypothetical protein
MCHVPACAAEGPAEVRHPVLGVGLHHLFPDRGSTEHRAASRECEEEGQCVTVVYDRREYDDAVSTSGDHTENSQSSIPCLPM